MVNFLLAFPVLSGNPGIKEEPGCASNHSSQKLRAFLHIRKSPESEEIFFPGSPSFSRNSWKARRAPTLLAFPGFFLAFPYVQKCQESQEFYPGIPVIPGSFLLRKNRPCFFLHRFVILFFDDFILIMGDWLKR